MPSYRCSQCGEHTDVPNTRGSRIKDHPCSHCGAEGTLQGATAGRKSRNAGRTYERCAACDKRGLDHTHPPFEWEPKYGYAARPGPFAAGSPACWQEEPVPAARTRHETIYRELEARLGRRGPASAWATEDDQRRLGLPVGREERWQDPRLREPCQVCGNTPARDEDGYCSHHISAYRFERGVAAVLVCEGCGHTRLLGELPDAAAAQEGADRLASLSETRQLLEFNDPVLLAATYPETVALSGVLVSPHWTSMAASDDAVQRERFYAEAARRLSIPSAQPVNNFDPLARWSRELRWWTRPDETPPGERP